MATKRTTRHALLATSVAMPLFFYPPSGAGAVTYDDVAPLLATRCIVCHTGDAAPLGLRLDSLAAILKGSKRGPVVLIRTPGDSELIKRIKGLSTPRMPMTGPPFLNAEEVARFEAWISDGLQAGTAAQAGVQAVSLRPEPGQPATYAHVAPIFAQRCAKCHSANGIMGTAPEGYRLTSYQETLSLADRLRVVPGNPDASELVRRIRGRALSRMPFDGPPYLSEEEQNLIADWIAQGARDAAGKPAPTPVGAQLRLQGTLSSHWVIDDISPVVTASTRIDKSPKPGDLVELRARIDADGNIIAERIRRR